MLEQIGVKTGATPPLSAAQLPDVPLEATWLIRDISGDTTRSRAESARALLETSTRLDYWVMSAHNTAVLLSFLAKLTEGDEAGRAVLKEPRHAVQLGRLINIARQCARNGESGAQSLWMTAAALTKLGAGDPRLIAILRTKAKSKIKMLQPRELASLVSEHAAFRIADEPLFNLLSKEIQSKLPEFGAHDLVRVAWAYSTLSAADPALFSAIASAAAVKAPMLGARDICIIAHAFARFEHKAEDFLDALGEAARARIQWFDPQALSLTAWSYARLGHANEKTGLLFEALAGEIRKQIALFTPRELANAAWAFATLEIRDGTFFEACARETLKKIEKFNCQDLCDMAWAFFSLDIEDAALFQALGEEAESRICCGGKNHHDVAHLASALSYCGAKERSVFEPIAAETKRNVQKLSPIDLFRLVTAFASIRFNDKDLYDCIAAEIARRMSDFNPMELSQASAKLAGLGIDNRQFYDALVHETEKRFSQFTPRDLSCTVWALAVFEPPGGRALIQRAHSMLWADPSCFDVQSAARIQHAAVAVSLEEAGNYPPYWKGQFETLRGGEARQSAFEAEVAEVLEAALGTRAVIETSPVVEMIHTDIRVTLPDEKWLIECDGIAWHRIGGRPTGKDIIQDKIFRQAGYRVLHIPDSEWYQLRDREGWFRFVLLGE